MRTWWKKIGVLAGGLLGVGCVLSPVAAQPAPTEGGGSMLSRLFGGAPAAPAGEACPPDFPNPGKGPAGPESSFTLKEGVPSAFDDCDNKPAPNLYRFTMRGEFLSWWVGRANVPGPLVTSSTAPNLATNFGALGQSNTNVLLGSPGSSYGPVMGGRATIGIAPGFLPPMEVSGLFLNRTLNQFNGASDGQQLLARPVGLLTQPTLVDSPGQSAYLAGFPGIGGGTVSVQNRFNLWAIDVDSFFNIADNGTMQLDLIGGYKHAQLNESLNIGNTFQSNVGQFFNGQVVPAAFSTGVVDQFSTRNQFDGATFGFRNRINSNRLMMMTDAKLSAGYTQSVADIRGYSSLFGAGGSLTVPGGILAGPSNGGTMSRNRFAVIPEANVTLSYQLFNSVRVFAGYSALYWSSVGRAGDQVNTAIDPRQVPIDQSFSSGFRGIGPTHNFTTTGFFAHGVNVGLEVGF